jgi:hypothetical protein
MKKLVVTLAAAALLLLPLDFVLARGGGGRGAGRAGRGTVSGGTTGANVRTRDTKKDQAKTREISRLEDSESILDRELGRRSR